MSDKKMGSGSGFFNNITSGLGDAIATTAREVLPRWTAQELLNQQNSQLANSTFNRMEAEPRLAGYAQTTGHYTGETQKTGFLDVNISDSSLLLIVIGIAGFIMFIR